MYHQGSGGSKDDKKAVKLLEEAGRQGLSDAYSALSLMYYAGDGVDKNPSRSKKYSELAASTNDGVMKFYLARMYETGNGTLQNESLARKWYHASCNKGFPPGCKKFAQLNNQISHR